MSMGKCENCEMSNAVTVVVHEGRQPSNVCESCFRGMCVAAGFSREKLDILYDGRKE